MFNRTMHGFLSDLSHRLEGLFRVRGAPVSDVAAFSLVLAGELDIIPASHPGQCGICFEEKPQMITRRILRSSVAAALHPSSPLSVPAARWQRYFCSPVSKAPARAAPGGQQSVSVINIQAAGATGGRSTIGGSVNETAGQAEYRRLQPDEKTSGCGHQQIAARADRCKLAADSGKSGITAYARSLSTRAYWRPSRSARIRPTATFSPRCLRRTEERSPPPWSSSAS